MVYTVPLLGTEDSASIVAIQAGDTIAGDLTKAGCPVMSYTIAREKAEADGWVGSTANSTQGAVAASFGLS